MKEAIIIYPAHGQGYAYAVSFPKELVESFRTLFPLQDDRDWQPPVWCFKRKHLPQVQTWVAERVQELHLALYDLTGMAKAKREQILAEIWEKEHEEHIVAMTEVLPKLPPGALCLAKWFSTHLVLDLTSYLGKPLFDELIQATLPAGKVPQTKEYIPGGASHNVRLSATPDPRILRALKTLRIKNFQVQRLTVIQHFENGTAQFNDEDGKLWFGAPYQQLVGSPFDPYQDSSLALPYSIMEAEESIYLVAQVDEYLERFCLSIAPPYISGLSPSPSTEKLAALIEHFSLEAWLRSHITDLLQVSADDLTPHTNSSHMQLLADTFTVEAPGKRFPPLPGNDSKYLAPPTPGMG